MAQFILCRCSCKVTTAEALCAKYNQGLRAEHEKLQKLSCDLSNKLLSGELDPKMMDVATKNMRHVQFAPEGKLTKGWALRYRRAFGWIKRATNTHGVFLPYDHPKMASARNDFQADLDSGIDRRLYLNVDQVRRSAYAGNKYTLRKAGRVVKKTIVLTSQERSIFF